MTTSLLVVGIVSAESGLPVAIQRSLDTHGVDAKELGILVLAESDGKIRLSHLANRPMSPASTLKTLTTIAALDTLGPDYHWKTDLLAVHQPEAGVLRGPLYLRGGAEPNLSWDKFGLMLRALREQGINQIDGDLIVDRSLFSPSRLDLNVAPFDSTPGQYYNVIPDAMLVNANLIELNLSAGTDQIAVHFLPPLQSVEVRSQLQLNDENCADWDEEWPVPEVADHGGNPAIILNGTFPRNCRNQTTINILDRNLYIERLVRALWHEFGGQWNGRVIDGVTPPQAQILTQHVSESLADIVRIINKRSDNTMARDLYLTLGVQAGNSEAALTLNVAQHAVQSWLQRQHIDETGLVLENGSGLSRIERISPMQLAKVLRAAARSSWSAEFKSSLPIFGMDGTMATRKTKIAPGTARLKGGTLNNTAAIAGYVRDIHGKEWIVVGIINRPEAARGKLVLDDLINWVANHPVSRIPATITSPTL